MFSTVKTLFARRPLPRRRCLRLSKLKPSKEESYWFVEANEPSPQRKTSSLAKISHFGQFLAILKAYFLKPINFGSLDLSRVWFLEEEHPP